MFIRSTAAVVATLAAAAAAAVDEHGGVVTRLEGSTGSGEPAGVSDSDDGSFVTFADTLASGGLGPVMVVIPAGSFRMGCLNDDGCYLDEFPVHTVDVPRFALSKYELTFEQWDACVDAGGCSGYRAHDRGWGRGDRPVIRLNHAHAQAYVSWLSEQTGKDYRVPSESEWEYAARAGTETQYDWGNSIGVDRANCTECGSEWDHAQTAPVGSFAANPWGMFDMHGNVWEWTADCDNASYDGAPADGSAWTTGRCTMRVLRGGAWDSHPDFLRARYRGSADVSLTTDVIGLRVAREIDVVPSSGKPDLEARAATVTDANPEPGGAFTLAATARNAGAGASAATTLRYYRSADATVSTSDTSVGTDAIAALAAGGKSAESVPLTAPAGAGTYYYGACVDTVADESDAPDNCSASVRVDVGLSSDATLSGLGLTWDDGGTGTD
ncbi:MAG: SUMF1/EgtB/PvdO family nonheme iron enzyme, partial [Gammaproteobacteria bacterium]|nr:SUMF1/EgtB/PvdO family nonheme iron enzyme [Gammaproteobacteria bacterium]